MASLITLNLAPEDAERVIIGLKLALSKVTQRMRIDADDIPSEIKEVSALITYVSTELAEQTKGGA